MKRESKPLEPDADSVAGIYRASIEEFLRVLRRQALRLGLDTDDASDAAHDAFLSFLLRKTSGADGPTCRNAKGYILGIARHFLGLSRRRCTRRVGRERIFADPGWIAASAAEGFSDPVLLEAIAAWLSAEPTIARDVIERRYGQAESLRRAAHGLGLGIKKVRNLERQAFRRLRRQLRDRSDSEAIPTLLRILVKRVGHETRR